VPVWREGFTDWTTAENVREIVEKLIRPPPLVRRSSAIPPPLPGPAQPSELAGVPVSRLVDLRHELTALIKQNLYGGGSKPEGQAALIARNSFDESIFGMTDNDLMTGSVDNLRPLKRGIILETYGELLEILDDYARRFGNGGKAVKQGMSAIVSDPDVLGRFDSARQAEIRAIAAGSSILAQRRFDRLHLSIRTEIGNSWAWLESQAAQG
jgi:hypothetical protein